VRCAAGEIPRARAAHCAVCDRVYDVDATGTVTELTGETAEGGSTAP
jgi:hypothetical protein